MSLMICVICVEAVPIDFGESIIALPRAKPCLSISPKSVSEQLFIDVNGE